MGYIQILDGSKKGLNKSMEDASINSLILLLGWGGNSSGKNIYIYYLSCIKYTFSFICFSSEMNYMV